ARVALERVYRDRGFATVFVDIPVQEVNDGVVRLHVSEGKIRVRQVEGARFFSERDVAAALPRASVGAAPDIPRLQQQLAELNAQTTDRSVVPILKAGPVPGTVDLDFKVTDMLPVHGSIEINDAYTVDTKPLRASAGLSYTNLFDRLDSLSVQYQD